MDNIVAEKSQSKIRQVPRTLILSFHVNLEQRLSDSVLFKLPILEDEFDQLRKITRMIDHIPSVILWLNLRGNDLSVEGGKFFLNGIDVESGYTQCQIIETILAVRNVLLHLLLPILKLGKQLNHGSWLLTWLRTCLNLCLCGCFICICRRFGACLCCSLCRRWYIFLFLSDHGDVLSFLNLLSPVGGTVLVSVEFQRLSKAAWLHFA